MSRAWSKKEEKHFRRMKKVFTSDRDNGTVGFVELDNLDEYEEIFTRLKSELPNLKHIGFDFSRIQITSLDIALKRNLKPEVLQSEPVTYMVHVFGLENSVYRYIEGEQVQTSFIGQINIERETLWQFPFHIMIWCDNFLARKLGQEAIDFWSWVTDHYRFESETKGVVPSASVFRGLGSFNSSEKSSKSLLQRIQVYLAFLHDLVEQNEGRWNDQTLLSKAKVLYLLGQSFGFLGITNSAMSCLKSSSDSLAVMKVPDLVLKSEILRLLALCHRENQDYDSFNGVIEEQQEVAKKIDYSYEILMGKISIAVALIRQGKSEKANSLVVDIAEEYDSLEPHEKKDTFSNLSEFFIAFGYIEKLEPIVRENEDILNEVDGDLNVRLIFVKASIHKHHKRYQAAFDMLSDSIKMWTESTRSRDIFQSKTLYLEIAVKLHKKDRFHEALKEFTTDPEQFFEPDEPLWYFQTSYGADTDLISEEEQQGYLQRALEYAIKEDLIPHIPERTLTFAREQRENNPSPELAKAIDTVLAAQAGHSDQKPA
jgi:hypothetical protein